MSNLNSAALDRYITGNYGEDQYPDEPVQPRCKCGCMLPFKPDRVEDWEDKDKDENGKEVIVAAGVTEFRKCKRCGNDNKTSIC
jgi:hypothetical protein